jgi:hypothetical protein
MFQKKPFYYYLRSRVTPVAESGKNLIPIFPEVALNILGNGECISTPVRDRGVTIKRIVLEKWYKT